MVGGQLSYYALDFVTIDPSVITWGSIVGGSIVEGGRGQLFMVFNYPIIKHQVTRTKFTFRESIIIKHAEAAKAVFKD